MVCHGDVPRLFERKAWLFLHHKPVFRFAVALSCWNGPLKVGKTFRLFFDKARSFKTQV